MISVVIPAFNEEKYIKTCLDSLAKQKTGHGFEVILVDNNSTDTTVEIARSFNNKFHLRIVTEIKRGRGAARAKGFSQARGEIIFSTDADTAVPSNWLESLSQKMNNSQIGAISGPCNFRDLPVASQFILNRLQPIVMFLYRLVHGYFWLSGFNFAIRKDVYNKSGGFNPQLQAFEDIDLSRRVSRIVPIHYASIGVSASGRRLHKSPVKGLFDYIGAYFDYFMKKKHQIEIQDIR